MKIINLGSLNIDYVYGVENIVRPGETIPALSVQVFSGGKGLNQSVALGRAGADALHAGLIGQEQAGLIQTLEQSGVNTKLVKKSKAQTGHAFIQVDATGQNSIVVFGGANLKITKEFIKITLSGFHKEDMLLLQNEVSCSKDAIELAAEKGMSVCFNPSPFTEELKSYPIDKINWLILNKTEGSQMSGSEEPDEIIRVLTTKYKKTKIVLTLGSKGAICYDGKDKHYQKSYSVRAVDTTGAGDTFTGYFLASIAKKNSIPQALQIASAAAALAVTKKGAAVSIPTMDSVLSFIAENI